MPQSRDDDEPKRPSKPGDHLASKLDAFNSSRLQDLAKDILIVEGPDEEGIMLCSLLRALLGRHVNARRALGLEGALLALATSLPNLVLWRERAAGAGVIAGGIGHLRAAGFQGPVVVIVDALSVAEAVGLRRAGALDVIEIDELDSVRLSHSLFRAIGDDPGSEWQSAYLA